MKESLHQLKTLRARIPMLLLAMVVSVAGFAQDTSTVSGQVKDATDGSPLPGVNIVLKGTTNGTQTDADGRYSLNVPNGTGVLVISYIGYTTQEIDITSRTVVDVSLSPDASQLDEVVIVGYGEVQKKDLTGAISVVDTKQLQQRQATTVAEALQGLATGITVRGGGQPGSEAAIEIRGLKSFNTQNPLYVIDGLITTANRDFNPNDIESIQILKDASAAAIYGSRAANGVIIITTKKGADGPMKVEFSAKTGIQTTPRYDLAETPEFARLNYMAYDNAGVTRQNLNTDINTDWQDAAFQTGSIQDYNLGFSGGSKNGTYMVSANYFANKGVVISTDFERFSLRVNSQGTKGIFSIGENIALSNSKADEMSGNPYMDVVRLLPTIPVYDENNPGGYGYGSESAARTFGTNPVAIADLEDRSIENFRIRGNVWAEAKILPSLKYRLNLGYETSFDFYQYHRKVGNWSLNQPLDLSVSNQNRARWYSGLVENTLTFDKIIGKHSINVVAGQTFQRENYGQLWGTKRGMPTNPSTGEYFWTLDQGANPEVGSFIQEAVLLSYLGRINYSYDDKYLFSAVLRRDGTSRVSAANRWGNFPSVSAGWRISGENFYNISWMNELKIRANYGQLGSSNIGFWDYQRLINTFSTAVFGYSQNVYPGATNVRLANDNLRWETLTQTNFGVDAGFFNNSLKATIEYYISDAEDILTGLPIALTTGNDGGNPLVNAASFRNKGFELSLTYNSKVKDIEYFVTANVTTIRNEVLDLGYGRTDIYSGNTRTEIGHSVGEWYVLKTDGIFQSMDEVLAHQNSAGVVIQPGAQPGDVRFVDRDDNGMINNEDKFIVGSPWADFELGLNLGASYKGFSLLMNWFGSYGATVFNGPRSVTDRFDDNSNYRAGIKPWTPENGSNTTPRAYYASTLNSRGDSDRWLENGSFTRLKFVSITYTLPEELVKRVGFERASVSIQGQNLLTFTKYTGLDPEFRGVNLLERGFDNAAFPNLRTVSLGVQLGF